MITRWTTGVAAIAAALVGALAPGLVAASPADAATATATANPASAAATIDPAHPASLTLHLVQNADDGAHPFAGVAITIRPVTGIDLGATTGWADAFALSGAFDAADPEGSIAAAGHGLGAPRSRTTGGAGVAAFTGLPIGAYLVTETVPSLGGISTVAPFVVLLPVTDAAGTGWDYGLDLTPKTDVVPSLPQSAFVTKRVDEPDGHRVGDRVAWHIVGDILDGGSVLWWRATDVLDARLDFVDLTVRLDDGTPLAEGEDYTVTEDAATNAVTVEFTGPPGTAGLAKLTAHHTARVEIDLVTRVLDAAAIPNTAEVNTAIWDDPVGVVRTVDATSDVARITPAAATPWWPTDPDLPFTGVNPLLPAAIGAALTTLGFLLVVWVRRRRGRDRRQPA